MKKLYLGIALLFTSAGLMAQNSIEAINAQFHFAPAHQPSIDASRSTNCGQDTVLYALAKATGLSSLSINNVTSASALGQYFECPQSMVISGTGFYAYKINATGGTSINVTASIYLAGADSLPTGVPLASVNVPVDTSFYGGNIAQLYKTATFAAPVTVNAPYIIVVENNSANSIGLLSNSYAAANGGGEWLAAAKIGANWLNSSDVVIGGATYNADVLFEPFVSYALTSDFSMSNSCFNSPTTVNFTNQSSPILSHRMYNQLAFPGGNVNLSYYWNYGDGSPVQSLVSPSHAYTGTGPWNITLRDTILGWTTICADSKTKSSYTSTVASFTNTPNGLSVAFADATTGNSTAWSWTFGDGSPASTDQNPSHTYATTGTYEVCLNATGVCESDQICDSVTVCIAPTATYTSSITGADAALTSTTVGTVTYSWNFGDGTPAVTSANTTHTFADNGTYNVCLTVTNGCGTGDTCSSIAICRAPEADFSSAETTLGVRDFTNESTYGDIFSWNFDDGNTSSDENPTHTFAANDSYNVCLTVTNTCGVGSDEFCEAVVVQGLGISEEVSNMLSLYPNPAKAQVFIKLNKDFDDMNGTVMNAVGQTVQSFVVNHGTPVILLNIESLSSGIYFVKLTDGKTQLVKRFVVSK